MINDKSDKIIEKFFDLLKNRYQSNLESMKSSEFVFDYVHLQYYKCHKINTNRGGSKKATVTVALYHEKIRKNPERITRIKPFINKYKSEKEDWKRFENNNVTIVLNVLHAKKEKIYPVSAQKLIKS